MTSARWISFAILALALALRLALLGLKPAHFDEGVNGWFVDQMTREGFYHYDPTNFHGPLHFYVLFAAQTLFGRHEWALRLPLALASTGCVAMLLAYRAYLGERVCQLAALAMAISPGFVFYGRYAIHESWLVFFLELTVWGLAGLCHFGTRRFLWAAGLGVTGAILIKETYFIHAAALTLGYLTLLALERFSPSAPFTAARQQWTRGDLLKVATVSASLVIFFYSGGLLDWPGPQTYTPEGVPLPRGSICGLYETFAAWIYKGVDGSTGHEKPPWYWLELLAQYEWPALLGLLGSIALAWPRSGRTLRWIAISAVGALCAYSLVAYKTPWCVISIVWPFYFVFAAGVLGAAALLDRWAAGTIATLLLGYSLGSSILLNFRNFTRETEPYVYVQTLPALNKLLDPLRALAARDAVNCHLTGYIVLTDIHPLPWLLADFTQVKFTTLSDLPADVSDGEFFLTNEEFAEEVERSLRGAYFREKIYLRGNSGAFQMLYLRAPTFAAFFPNRTPEFDSAAGAILDPVDSP